MTLGPSGTIYVKRVGPDDNFYEESLDASDIPITTTGSNFQAAGIGGSYIQDSFSDVADVLASSGVAGKDVLIFSTTTSGNTEATLGQLTIPDETVFSFRAIVSARYDNVGSNKSYWAAIEGGVRRNNSGSAALIGTRVITEDSEGSPGYLSDVDVSGNNLRLRVTGGSGENVGWDAKVLYVTDQSTLVPVSLLTTFPNDDWLKWENNAASSNINVLKLNSNDVTLLNSTSGVELQVAGITKWSVGSDGNLIFTKANASIIASTADGSDSSFVSLCGGGAASNARGAWLQAYGNESGSPGTLFLSAGNTASGRITLRAYQGIDFYAAGSITWQLTAAGNIVPNSTGGAYSIGDATHPVSYYGTTFTTGANTTSNIRILKAVGSSTCALEAQSTTAQGHRALNIYNSGTASAFVQVNSLTVHSTFTGTHVYDKDSEEVISEGDAVKLVDRKLVQCTTSNDSACIGIFTNEVLSTEGDGQDIEPQEGIEDSFGTIYLRSAGAKTLFVVASTGDSYMTTCSGAKVCDQGGAVSAGDLLVTASGAGFLRKQEDDIVRSRTVAKAVESVTFDENGEATGVYVYLLN